MNLRSSLLALSTGLLTAQAAADYQDGLDAYSSGDYRTAMKEWLAVVQAPAEETNPAVYSETHYAIAMLYWTGQGNSRDFYAAKEWLLKAADLDHAGAMSKLGYLYTEGIAVPRDYDRAFDWYAKAARLGDVDGQYNLGIFYLNGWGTAQDATMAKLYLAAASAQGDAAAEEALQELLARDDETELIKGEPWILGQDPAHYTIQVIGLSSRGKLEALVAGFENLAPFAAYTVQKSGDPIHVLVQGVYASVEEARKSRDRFPREISPPDRVWIRQFIKIQQIIRAEQQQWSE